MPLSDKQEAAPDIHKKSFGRADSLLNHPCVTPLELKRPKRPHCNTHPTIRRHNPDAAAAMMDVTPYYGLLSDAD
jgi:hypothetical protein